MVKNQAQKDNQHNPQKISIYSTSHHIFHHNLNILLLLDSFLSSSFHRIAQIPFDLTRPRQTTCSHLPQTKDKNDPPKNRDTHDRNQPFQPHFESKTSLLNPLLVLNTIYKNVGNRKLGKKSTILNLLKNFHFLMRMFFILTLPIKFSFIKLFQTSFIKFIQLLKN